VAWGGKNNSSPKRTGMEKAHGGPVYLAAKGGDPKKVRKKTRPAKPTRKGSHEATPYFRKGGWKHNHILLAEKNWSL